MPNSTAADLVAIILAAGLSRRFGGDKLLFPLRGKALAAHIADTLAAMPLRHRIAVCPPDAPERAELFRSRGFGVVENPDPERGMGTSLALGAEAAMAMGATAVLVCLADMPNVTAAHLDRLIDASQLGGTVATAVDGTRTPPAIFPGRLLPELARLTGDRGARQLLERAAMVEASPELVRDFDTPSDFY